MAINSRAKGAAGEREFANHVKARGHEGARRGQQFCGGPSSPDVVIPEYPGFHFEVKRVEAGNPYVWLQQAKDDAAAGSVPVVAHRRNREEWIAVVRLDDLLDLIETKLHFTSF